MIINLPFIIIVLNPSIKQTLLPTKNLTMLALSSYTIMTWQACLASIIYLHFKPEFEAKISHKAKNLVIINEQLT